MTTPIEQIDHEDDEFKIVKMHVARLSEHFDSVVVMVSRHDFKSGKTISFVNGEGNYNARYGLAKEWVLKEERSMGEGYE